MWIVQPRDETTDAVINQFVACASKAGKPPPNLHSFERWRCKTQREHRSNTWEMTSNKSRATMMLSTFRVGSNDAKNKIVREERMGMLNTAHTR